MSAHANPDIIDDGLVFMYDTDDGKSYKGEPTTNFMPTVYKAGSNITSGSDSVGDYFDGTITRIGCPNVTYINSGSTYTFSIEIRSNQTFNMSADSNQYAPENAGNDNNRVSVTYIRPNYTTPNEWVKYSTTVVMKSGLTNPYMFDFFIPQSFTGRMYYRNAQLEYKPHATPFIPSGTTRSSTQGLLDRTGNTTIDLSNVSFDSNAQMTFDGTDDYIALPSDIRSIFTSYPNCMECVLKKSSSDQGDMVAFDVDITRWNLNYNMYVSNQWSFDFYDGTEHVIAAGNYDDEYVHFVLQQLSDGTMQIYANGVLKGSSAASNLSPNGSSIRIGSRSNGDSRYFKGDIPIMKIYNKALTSTEVLQNFNATKSRFGL